MGFRGGGWSQLDPPQHILVFKYPSRDRVNEYEPRLKSPKPVSIERRLKYDFHGNQPYLSRGFNLSRLLKFFKFGLGKGKITITSAYKRMLSHKNLLAF